MKHGLRKLLLLVLSIVAVTVVLLFYQWLAGPKGTSDSEPNNNIPSAPVDLAGIKRIGSTDSNLESAEQLEYYRRGPGGRVERVYRAERFHLQSEDQALLKGVTFVWHLKNGQTLTLTSDTGQVHLDRGANRMQPTSGLLSGNVQIVFRVPNASTTGQPPAQQSAEELVINTDELEFDTRSCRLWTDRAVRLRGTDLDANGTGFLLRWREISQEIDRLIIQKGGELTWRGGKGRAFGNLIDEPNNTVEPAAGPDTSEPLIDPEKIHSYIATFDEDVRITYNDRYQVQTIHNIDRLNVLFDLILSSRSSEDEPSSANKKDPPPKQSDDMYQSSPLRLTWNGPLTVVPTEPQTDSSVASRRLRFEALGSPVTFNTRDVSGSCAKLEAEQDSGIVRLSSSSDVRVFLESSDGTKVITEQLLIDPPARDARGVRLLGKGSLKTSDITSQQMTSTRQKSNAIDLSWQESASLKFIRQNQRPDDQNSQIVSADRQTNSQEGFYLAEANATGQVVAVSDQLTTKANMIHVELDPPGSDGTDKGQAIRVLRAENDFSADLPSKKGKLTVSADIMETSFSRRSSGKGQFASSINLKGNVLATEQTPQKQSESKLECQKMLISLVEEKDTTIGTKNSYGKATVSKLVAEENVIGRYLVKGKTHSSLHADKLVADESTHTTTLYGKPAQLRRGQNDRLNSETIIIKGLGKATGQDRNYVLITPGAGQMRVMFPTAEQDSPSALLGLEWTESLTFDGETNKAVFRSLDKKRVTGAILHSPTSSSQFVADRLELHLQDKRQTSPPDMEVSTEDIVSSETFFKPMGNRTLQRMVMTGRAEIRNIEHPAGQPEQRLRAALLTSNVLTYVDKKRQFFGDGPGSLLLEDYRQTDKKVSAAQTTSVPERETRRQRGGPALQRVGPGQTAFEWKKSAKYYQDERTAVLAGDVHMVSMGYALALPGRSATATGYSEKERHRTELWCQTFTITFAEPKTQASETDKSNFADLSAMDELDAKRVEASGNASLVSKDIRIEGAQSILYDRKTEQIVIQGSRKSKASVVYLDPQRGQWVEWTGKLAHYNVATGELKAKGNFRVLY
ncbi:MAG: hypothetical protein GWP14_05030 [Actinobacteria bacterium]|nr:hypothetical protein [Actinomycetota bacterium]